MTDAERRLLQLLTERSFQRGTFTLASGGTSDYYIDGRTSAVYSEAAHLIGEVVYERTRDLPVDAIGGLATGAIPITTAAVIAYHHHGRPMDGFWVRDEVKKHGTQKQIEGNLRPGAKVVVVDDVFTKGGSALKAVQAVREIGCEVLMVLALVDRLQGARALFREHGIETYRPVFTIRDFGIDAPAEPEA
ncbi:MAG: orotate phosphoribosyltransferase [Gemmataceae bacterium]|nr:orotate phosphoribosyltransferase [Gemmataceae bacterium]